MIKHEKNIRDQDKHEANRFAEIITATRGKSLLNSFIGVALSSYMNGINDACKSFDATKALADKDKSIYLS